MTPEDRIVLISKDGSALSSIGDATRTRRPRWLAIVAAVAVAAWLGSAGIARAAATISVTTLTDDPGTASAAKCPGNACSLRDAIAYSNANAGTTVDLPSGTVQLLGSELLITAPVTINGGPLNGGAGGSHGTGTVIDQQASSGARVFEIDSSSGQVTIAGVEITGGNVTTAAGGEGGGVLIDSGASGANVTLSGDLIDHNTVTGSAASGAGAPGNNAYGGGISITASVSGTVTVAGTTVLSNTVTASGGAPGGASSGGSGGWAIGGGIQSFGSGPLTIDSGSVISFNTATSGTGGTSTTSVGAPGDVEGGGLDVGNIVDSFLVTISNSTISGNSGIAAPGQNVTSGHDATGGPASGGGIFTQMAGMIAITNTTIAGNTVTAGVSGTGGSAPTSNAAAAGAGMYLSDQGGIVIRQSTISGNLADGSASDAFGSGGAIYTQSTMTVVDSTLANNTATTHTGVTSVGGGIWENGHLTLASDTLVGNSATSGSNIFNWGADVIMIGSSVLAVPLGGGTNCGKQSLGFQDLTTPGGNLEDDQGSASCGFTTGGGDIVGQAPALGQLTANGGPTLTMLPLPGSPLIHAGGACEDPSASPVGPLTVDQRGYARPSGGPCDIGAAQVQALSATSAPSISPTNPVVGQTVTCGQGGWFGDGALLYAHTFTRNGTPIPGYAAATYTTTPADVGRRISCRVTATSPYGYQATSAQSSAVTVIPMTLHVRQSHSVWREPGSARRHRVPVGTTFTIIVNTAAQLTLSLARTGAHGVLRRLPAELIVVAGKVGANKVKVNGVLTRHDHLKTGRYTVTIAATATHSTVTKTVKLHFRIKS